MVNTYMNLPSIAYLGAWNSIHGVSEYGRYLVQGLTNLGHDVTILSSTQEPGTSVSWAIDGTNVYRKYSSTDIRPEMFDATSMLEVTKRHESGILIVNYYEDLFPNKARLANFVQEFLSVGGRKAYCVIHDGRYNPSMNFGVFTSVVLPNTSFTAFPPNARSIKSIDQGIPEFSFPSQDREDFKHDHSLPVWKSSDPLNNYPVGYLMSVMGLGKAKWESLLMIVEYLNKTQALQKNLYLQCFMPCPDPGIVEKLSESDYTFIHTGFIPDTTLAQYIHGSDITAVWYSDAPYQATSAALRFAIGCKVPTLGLLGTWTRDMKESLAWLQVRDDHPEPFKNALVDFFRNYPFNRNYRERCCSDELQKRGWSVIAKQWSELVSSH
jgi:hypothetical protein